MSRVVTTQYSEGSAEDLQLTVQLQHNFFAEKLKAAELYGQQGATFFGTDGTKSVCHIDGTTDNDEGSILP